MVALRLQCQAAVGEPLRLADSKNWHPERFKSALDRGLTRALLRQARCGLLALNFQLLIRMSNKSLQSFRLIIILSYPNDPDLSEPYKVRPNYAQIGQKKASLIHS